MKKGFVTSILGINNDFGPNNANQFQFGVASNDLQETTSLDLDDIVIILRSQHDSHQRKKADLFKKKLKEQIIGRSIKGQLTMKMLHEEWAPYGAWTIFPIIRILFRDYGLSKSWIFFCEDDTFVDLIGVLRVLSRYNHTKNYFLGHALHDPQPAIIHHFAFAEDPSKFLFPDFSAGWAVSSSLLKRLNKRLKKKPLETDFSIDVQHEVAMFIYNGGKGVELSHVPEFCTTRPGEDDQCVTSFYDSSASCGEVGLDEMFFAIKTTKKYHNDRVPVIKNTIGKHTSHIVYYSETVDAAIPTEDIGVPNTETGHCAKLWAIMENSRKNKKAIGKKWLIVADDDTILSVPRLQRLLACYDPKEPILMGERYGYGCNTGNGYEYITGGGSMILTSSAVEALLQGDCGCSAPDAPDDMILGQCYRILGLHTVHSPAFHQARPVEYAPKLLAHQIPVSFHKHREIDPYDVYQDYLN